MTDPVFGHPTRRTVLAAGGGTAVTGAAGADAAAPLAAPRVWDAVVVGAGVFGAWTAKCLRTAGQRALLLDAWGPAHARASSGGESRTTRSDYGPDAI